MFICTSIKSLFLFIDIYVSRTYIFISDPHVIYKIYIRYIWREICLKNLLMKVKEENEKVRLKFNIQKTKTMASGPITSRQIDGETVRDFFEGAPKITADGDCTQEIKRRLLLGRKAMINLLLLLLSRFSRVRLCATPEMAAHQAPPSLGFSRQKHWSGLPFPSPMHEREKWKWSHSVVSDS